jgi:ribonuclease P protein component
VLPARSRLRSRGDFTSVVRGRGPRSTRAGSRLLVVHATTADARTGQPPRVGFVVSAAVGGAVVRNRTRRRLRALVRARLDRLPPGTDVVVRANPGAGTASSRELAAALDPLWDKVIRAIGGVA